MLLSSTSQSGVSKSFGLAAIAMADYFASNEFDAIILLGDRYEALAIASIALIYNIPIIHLCGGELTYGAIDDAVRHSISKMATIHCVANQEYAKRVMQLGEASEFVYTVGGMGVDAISDTEILTKDELQRELNFEFSERNLLVTFHPTTTKYGSARNDFQELLEALGEFKDINLIFTMPNADTESDSLIGLIRDFVVNRENSIFIRSLGQKKYYSVLKIIDGVVGNSSSGICEAPSFKIGTINIGDRQIGRDFARSIIQCEPKCTEISQAISMLYDVDFQEEIKRTVNPYGCAGSTKKILEILKSTDFKNVIKPPFKDLDFKVTNE
jgi:GDP/UDP-N,N'-diacetylbacillosamine 2-epimerase (hydrolysing)